MTVASDTHPDGWTLGAEVPEADAQEQRQAAYGEPVADPEGPLTPALSSADAVLPGADEADLAEQALEVPWEDDEPR